MPSKPKLPALFLSVPLLWIVMLGCGPALAARPPSEFGVDAPELAHLGKFAVGVRTMALVERKQDDVLAFDPSTSTFPKQNRTLVVDLWYPAQVDAGATREIYTASLPSEPPAAPAKFSILGIAVRDAQPAGTAFPLVIVSHGYSNSPAAMTWLTENLASKGYVVAAIRHDDPPITDKTKFAELLVRRPLDIAFVMQSLQSILGREHLIDATRTALVGYSMGGYGVLTAAGATLDPTSPATKMVPGGLLQHYARGSSKSDAVAVKDLRAVVAMAPAGGGSLAAWGPEGLRHIKAPLLLISGDLDRTVDYKTGARAIFDAASSADRYLLTFKGCGHAIGLNPVPESMRSRLWDEDWFEDPVWRKERINAISAHFISAFLDRYVKGDASRAEYLDVQSPESDAGVWLSSEVQPYDAYSAGTSSMSVWKGFQRNHAAGLELLHADAAARAD